MSGVDLFTEIIARKGLNNVTVDSLVQDVTPKARGLVTAHALYYTT